MAHDVDPLSGFNFLVALGEIGGEDTLAGGFRAVEGLSVSIEQIEYRVGNEKTNAVRKLPGLRKYANVTLKRGLLKDTRLWDWINEDPPGKRTVVITLLDETRTPQVRFLLRNAWPVKWTGPELDAQANDVAIESVELAHEGLEVRVD